MSLREDSDSGAEGLSALSAQAPPCLEAVPSPPQPPEADAPAPGEWGGARHGAHYAALVLSAMFGTLIRLGFEALGDYDGRVVFPLAWAQGVGCGIMGLGNARKNQINWIYPPLVTFINTGVAGSTTTFSSWMLQGYESFANFGHYRRGGLYDTVDGFAYSLVTFGISYAGVRCGELLSSFLPRLPRPAASIRRFHAQKYDGGGGVSRRGLRRWTPTPLADAATYALALAAYGAVFAMYYAAPRYWRHRVVFALFLSPPGAMLRYALSKLNLRRAWAGRYPLGTFAANIIGTLVIAGVFAAQRRPQAQHAVTTCDGLYALEQGFCGCLSTVSTFMVEAMTLRKRWSVVYVASSVVLGQVLVMAVVGGVSWNLGYVPVCKGSDP